MGECLGCIVCDKKFINSSYLIRDVQFINSFYFIRHTCSHMGECLSCTVCDQMYIEVCAARTHKVGQVADVTFSCSLCNNKVEHCLNLIAAPVCSDTVRGILSCNI